MGNPSLEGQACIAAPPQQPPGQQELGSTIPADLGLGGEITVCGGVEPKTAQRPEGLLERGCQRLRPFVAVPLAVGPLPGHQPGHQLVSPVVSEPEGHRVPDRDTFLGRASADAISLSGKDRGARRAKVLTREQPPAPLLEQWSQRLVPARVTKLGQAVERPVRALPLLVRVGGDRTVGLSMAQQRSGHGLSVESAASY